MRFHCSSSLALALLFIGCSKKEEAETPSTAPTQAAEQPAAAPAASTKPATAAQAAPENLPGENQIRAALDRKDYSAAVNQLVALREVAQAGGKFFEYRQFAAEVGERLVEAAPKEPAANNALNLYRAAMYGQ